MKRGFSILEALVIVALIAAILLIVVPNFFRMMQRWRIQSTAATISTNLNFARAAAIKQKKQYRVQIKDVGESPANTYRIQRDVSGDSGTYENYTKLDLDIPDGVDIKSGSLDEVVFDMRGAASPNGTITLESNDGSEWTITISPNGHVKPVKTS